MIEIAPVIVIENRAIEYFTCPNCLAFYVFTIFILHKYHGKEFSFEDILELVKNNFDNIDIEDLSLRNCVEIVFDFMKK
jgi:hypothetical protein